MAVRMSFNKVMGSAVAALTILLWVVTLWTDRTPEAISAAAALTIIVVIAGTVAALN